MENPESQSVNHLDWIQHELDLISNAGLKRFRRSLNFCPDGSIIYRKKKLVNFASSDYLAFSKHPYVIRSAYKALNSFGAGAGASPLVSGYTRLHRSLEREIAQWEGFDDALVFSSGFGANLGVISALVHPKDLILCDSLNHASIIDGCRLSRATLRFYKHKDCDHLQNLLLRDRGKFRKLWILSDSLFSMDGDYAPIETLYQITLKNDAMLILDEAHATGVTGEDSRGFTDTFPLDLDWKNRVIKLGTLSKALASQGGFVCADRKIIALIKNKARSYIFSTALSPVCVAAARAAIKLIIKDNSRRVLVDSLAAYLRSNLLDMGLDIGPSQSHIIPIIFGNAEKTMRISKALLEQGYLVPPIRPPSVPENSSRLRVSITAFHSYDLINGFLLKLKEVLSRF
ncbi:MAG: 8-amino-7-oxononanoate synthase [Planctomycetes bacterium]|nr:8-amino-7-oxononanoate synthase [Planctomycetota bacterium]NBY03730.1 8-amino-7-oxononanoate synthase [Planctomycetota bacterium]